MIVTYSKALAIKEPMRAKVDRLEAALQQMPQVETVITHHFASGLYARSASLKAGCVYTGAVHKTQHLIMLAKGRVEVVTDTGTKTYRAGDIIICEPGKKNAVYALEDAVWANFFPTHETDPEKLVSVLTESTACELIGGSKNKQALCNTLKKVV